MEQVKGCLCCGGQLVYRAQSFQCECDVCHQIYTTNIICENGHYVCDKCHAAGINELLLLLKDHSEKDPVCLLKQVMNYPPVHMHGPEHHAIVPAVILTAYKNCGGELDLPAALTEAIDRGSKVPGGACGYWGACGAAVGAGFAISIITGATPLTKKEWSFSNLMTARCLEKMAEVGGPRCCKRNSYLAIETAVDFIRKQFGIIMPFSDIICGHQHLNKECIKEECPYYKCL